MTQPPDVLHTPLCDLVGVRYPIVQTGMGWVAGPQLVIATARAGGLGILAAATMRLPELADAVRAVRAATEAPFGVNIRADAPDAPERVDLLVREQVRVASFALAPTRDLVARCRDGGLVTMPSVGARRHAEKVAGWGVDALVVQGGEGGGHTGAVPTTLLLPQVVAAVDVPVVAAGGFFDGRGLVAALAYGASGIAMGTRFLLTRDSPVPEPVKRAYLAATVTDTVVTTRVDGVPHRVLRTPLVARLERTGRARGLFAAAANAYRFRRITGLGFADLAAAGRSMHRGGRLSWAQVLMAANTPMLLRAGLVEGRLDAGVLASGQVAGLIEDLPSVDELVQRIVAEATETLTRLGAVSPTVR